MVFFRLLQNQMHLVRVLPGFLRVLDIPSHGEKHHVWLHWFPSRGRGRSPLFGGESLVPAAAVGERSDGRGEGPEEDQVHPPRAAPGSGNLPWDTSRIPTELAEPQAIGARRAGGWGGGLAFVRGVDGGIGLGSGISSTAKIPSVCDWCVVGTPRSGIVPGGRRPRDVRNTQRQSGSGGNQRSGRGSLPSTAIRRRRSRLCLPARGHAAIPLFRMSCATGRVATSLRGIRVE